MTIHRITQFPFDGFEELLLQSQSEGFRFLARLEQDWLSGKNRFDQSGERLFRMVSENKIIGIGGINRDPYSLNERVGRLRRMYVHPNWRGQGAGAKLVQYIFDFANPYFHSIRLRTDTIEASTFYEKLGFQAVVDDADASHVILLK